MPSERVNWAQYRTVMALRNQNPRVKQFLARFDKPNPFDPCVFAFTSLPRFIRFSHNEGEDIPQVRFQWAAPVLQGTFSISHGSKSTMEVSCPPILLHHLSLQDSPSWHPHHDYHVTLLQCLPNPPWDVVCEWFSWVGLGQGLQLPHDPEAGLCPINHCNIQPWQSLQYNHQKTKHP